MNILSVIVHGRSTLEAAEQTIEKLKNSPKKSNYCLKRQARELTVELEKYKYYLEIASHISKKDYEEFAKTKRKITKKDWISFKEKAIIELSIKILKTYTKQSNVKFEEYVQRHKKDQSRRAKRATKKYKHSIQSKGNGIRSRNGVNLVHST